MPNLLFRHGQTDKNIRGGVDTYLTPLNEEGARQARLAGVMLRDYCLATSITRIQPVISALPQTAGQLIPFLRTYQTAALLLELITDIDILPVIAEARSRDIKFKPRGTESGAERLFSDRREVAGETLAALEQRIAGYHRDYLAEETPPELLILSVCHTTIGRFLVAQHQGQPLDHVEGHIPALNNLQGLAFTAAGIETVFEGFALSDEQRAAKAAL